MPEILMVRHGQAAFGTDDYDRLTEVGWEQSLLLGEYFASTGAAFDAVFTGTLRRHRETLAAIAEGHSALPQTVELAGLNEYDFHRLVNAYLASRDETIDQGDSRAFYRCLRRALLAWSRSELEDVAESWSDFENRVRDTMQSLAAVKGRALVISSGGPVSAVMRAALHLDVETMVNINLQAINTALTRYFCKDGAYRLNSFNAVPHLDNAQLRHLITYT